MVGSSASSVSPSLMSDSVGPASIRFRVAAARFIAKGETEPVLLAPRHDILSAIKVMSVSVAGTRGRSIGRLPHLWRADGRLRRYGLARSGGPSCSADLGAAGGGFGPIQRRQPQQSSRQLVSHDCHWQRHWQGARQLDRWICLASRIQLLLRSAGQVSSAARAKTIPSRLGSSAW